MNIDSENVEEFFEQIAQKVILGAATEIMAVTSSAQMDLMEQVQSIIDVGKSQITSMAAAKIIADGGVVFAKDFVNEYVRTDWDIRLDYYGKVDDNNSSERQYPTIHVKNMKKGAYRLIVIVEPLGPLEDDVSKD